jgi:E3 SUMO-protein ligase PIAS1
MVFCASEAIGPFSRDNADISFPHNVELKCNGDDVKANLRGLKNRPGSTRPVDITSMLRTKPANYNNIVEMVYALTTKVRWTLTSSFSSLLLYVSDLTSRIIYAEQDKSAKQKFYLIVNLVSKKSVDTMVNSIRTGRTISKEQVLRESKLVSSFLQSNYWHDTVRRKAADPDEIVATSTVLSLKDPVGYTRITTPCRGIGCSHNQCFDAAYYLQLQEQAPTWTCPICNKPVLWEQLALDQYVNDILRLTPKSVESVVVEPTGEWQIEKPTESGSTRKSNPTPSDDDDDDDIVEITNTSTMVQPKLETLTPHSVRTPPLSSREDSSVPSASRPSAPSTSSKRPHAVVDLTLSDDEEDARPAPKAPRLSSLSEDPIISSARVQNPTPDRYQFSFPPPLPRSYNFDRYTSWHSVLSHCLIFVSARRTGIASEPGIRAVRLYSWIGGLFSGTMGIGMVLQHSRRSST